MFLNKPARIWELTLISHSFSGATEMIEARSFSLLLSPRPTFSKKFSLALLLGKEETAKALGSSHASKGVDPFFSSGSKGDLEVSCQMALLLIPTQMPPLTRHSFVLRQLLVGLCWNQVIQIVQV